MNYLVVGAGNASRPVARLLNHLGHHVVITDLKEISGFKADVQRILLQMENEGIKLDLGNKNPNLDGIEAVYTVGQWVAIYDIFGRKIGTKIGGKAEIFGGIILIAIGLEIFITHVF